MLCEGEAWCTGQNLIEKHIQKSTILFKVSGAIYLVLLDLTYEVTIYSASQVQRCTRSHEYNCVQRKPVSVASFYPIIGGVKTRD